MSKQLDIILDKCTDIGLCSDPAFHEEANEIAKAARELEAEKMGDAIAINGLGHLNDRLWKVIEEIRALHLELSKEQASQIYIMTRIKAALAKLENINDEKESSITKTKRI